jgi:phospholipid-binding lipoprotein MlaA
MRPSTAAIRCAAIVFAAWLAAGCAASPSRDDPFEPMNRGLYQVHDAVDTAIMKPAIQMYIDVVPEPVRQAVSNVFNNVDDMISIVNDLLQGKLDKFGNDMGRVMLNTLWGVGGMFDLASMVGIERGNEDFGQTFAVWGFDQGPYLFVPIFGPTTFRDGAGWIARIAVGPVGYIPDVPVRNVLYGAGAVDLRAQAVGSSQLVETAALDRYLFIRNAYLQRRRYLVYDGKPPPEPESE